MKHTDKTKGKKYGFKAEDIKVGDFVTITHPYIGTVGMVVKRVKNKMVEGPVWQDDCNNYNMPEDYHGYFEYMNFPISCIKSLGWSGRN